MPLAAAISGGFGLANGIIGAIGQNSANKTYLKGIRETNEQNYKIWQEQQQHNIDMFNMQNDANVANWQNQFDQTNAYNTALAQRQRLEDAGLNPALMMNGGNSGVASSSGIPTASATPAQAPQMQAPQQVRSPLVEFANNAINSLQGIAEAMNLNAKTKTEEVTRDPLLEHIASETKKNTEDALETFYRRMNLLPQQKEAMWLENELNRKTLDLKIAYQDEIAKNMFLKNIGQKIDNETQQILLEFLPIEKYANLVLQCEEINLMYLRGELTKAERDAKIEEKIYYQAKSETEREFQKTEQKKRSVMDSEINANNAEANYYNEKGKTESYVRDNLEANTEDTRESTRGKKTANQIAEETAPGLIRAIDSENELKKVQNRKDTEIVDEYEFSREMKYILDPYKGWLGK